LGCNTYQGTAMAFLLPIAASLLFGPGAVAGRVALAVAQGCVFCAGLVLYFALNKFVIIPLGAHWLPAVYNSPDGHYHFDLTSSLVQKLYFGLTRQLPTAARLWWFDYPWTGYAVLLAMAFGALALVAWRLMVRTPVQSPASRFEPLLFLALIACAAFVADAPAILSSASGLFLRLLFPSSALFVLLLAWMGAESLRNSVRGFRIGLVAALCVAGISAHLTTASFAALTNEEVTIMRGAIGQLVQSTAPIRQLFVIRPPDYPTYFGHRVFSDEFNDPSSRDYGFAFAMVQVLSEEAGLPWLDAAKLRIEPTFDPAYFNGEINSSFNPAFRVADCKSGLVYLHEGAVIADMAAPLYLAPIFMTKNLGSCAHEFAYYSASPENSALHSSLKLFELQRSEDSFWETGPYPVLFRVRYAAPKFVKSYVLGAPSDATRMPLSWRLEGSADDVTWTPLDEERDQPVWSGGEQRQFTVARADAYRYYRLVFSKGSDALFRIATIDLQAADVAQTRWSVSYMGDDGQLVVKDVAPPREGSFVEGPASGKVRVEMNLPDCQRFSQYRFWVGPFGTDTTDRQPRAWTLSVRGDGDEWELADRQEISSAYGNDRWYRFPLRGDKGCIRHVRWDIDGMWKGSFFRLFEFALDKEASAGN
jgi:hypothetical protein